MFAVVPKQISFTTIILLSYEQLPNPSKADPVSSTEEVPTLAKWT